MTAAKVQGTPVASWGFAGFMPTFGPSWVNLYGSLRSYSFSDEHGTLNRGVGEGVAFRGQLLLGVDLRLADPTKDTMSVAALETHTPLHPLNIVFRNISRLN